MDLVISWLMTICLAGIIADSWIRTGWEAAAIAFGLFLMGALWACATLSDMGYRKHR